MRIHFTFCDLFAGIGGFRIGLERLGGQCVYSLEKDKFCRKTYAAWFGTEPKGCDIADDFNPADLPEHHIMTAGFPCQPFSLAGVSSRNSIGKPHGFECKKQGNLFFRLAETLGACRPLAFIFENVKNLKSHDKGRTWNVIQDTLTSLDYEVYADVIDAQDWGVPQHRERVFIVGFDKHEISDPKFTFPKPSYENKAVLQDILEDGDPPNTVLSANLWRHLRKHKAKHAALGHGFGFGIADPSGVTRTLPARYHKDGAEILISRGRRNPRRLSVREAARLMGFPDSLPIVVSNTQAYKQFGNSVVPNVVEAVSRAVVQTLQDAGKLIQTIPLKCR